MKDTLRKLADLMDAREKVRAVGFAVGMVAVGVLEMAAVAAVPVFVSIMNDPGVTDSYAPLREAFRSVGAETPVRRLVWAGGVLGALYLLRTAASLLLVSRQATFAFDLQERVSRRLFDAYLGAPYTFHLKRNPAQLLDHLMMVPGLVQNILLNTMRLLMELLVFAGILALLVAVEPVATLVAAAVLGSASGVFVWAMRRKLNHLAGWEFEYRQRMVRTINSALCGIKEVTALERRGFFRDRFADQLAGHTRAGRFRSVVAEVPRPTLETLSILGMLTVTGLLLLQGRPIEAIVPSLT
ncbi:MAG TPA: ABC transporter transmembrane domain-containing protein, partial [Planctomycetaceae bacterium]